MGPEPQLHIEVVYAPAPRTVLTQSLQLPAGSTVLDAIRASGLLQDLNAPAVDALTAGVWGRKQPLGHVLRDGDRVELYRPLRVDPKVARRERFARQGARGTGLFAQRRPGSKPGY